MPRPLSLLERLGGVTQEKPKPPEPQHVTQTEIKAEIKAKQQEAEEKKPTYTEKQIKQEREAPVEASAFVGKRAFASRNDMMQELKLAVHRRIVDEMTPEEQATLVRGEEAREQIKNIISVYATRELTESQQAMSRGERLQLVDDISNELLGLGPFMSSSRLLGVATETSRAIVRAQLLKLR